MHMEWTINFSKKLVYPYENVKTLNQFTNHWNKEEKIIFLPWNNHTPSLKR